MSCDWRFECVDCRTSYETERNHGSPCYCTRPPDHDGDHDPEESR